MELRQFTEIKVLYGAKITSYPTYTSDIGRATILAPLQGDDSKVTTVVAEVNREV